MLPGVPAHVVAQKALGIQDPAEAEAALVKAIQDKDTAKLKPIAEAWNTYFDATSLPADAGVYSSYGPYELTAFTDDGTMTFEANLEYKWGPQPNVKTIVYSIIGDPTAASRPWRTRRSKHPPRGDGRHPHPAEGHRRPASR